ncbi:MAG TPA: rhomboid family intramembrane serine protease [Acidobacteriaceae bacterium]|jgi:rhomboid protease GluP|nr:rhomboid family intramembrane serine protease [Acidobacteriaceae bacterium]
MDEVRGGEVAFAANHEAAKEVAQRAGEVTRGNAPRRGRRPKFTELIWAYPATSILVGINLAIFVVMFLQGPVIPLLHAHQYGQIFTAQFDLPTLDKFGACDDWMVLQNHQWWRLVTACFVHASILHIAVNLWCLWNLGLFGEPLLGRWGLGWVYLLTGVTGNLLGVAWSGFTHTEAVVVGASGAIFGIAGILIILLSNRKLNLPWRELQSLRRQVILFAVANLALGVAPDFAPALSAAEWARLHVNPESIPHIANTAHLGGFLSGLALGLPLFPKMTTGRANYRARQRVTFAVAALLLCLVGYWLAVATGRGPLG